MENKPTYPEKHKSVRFNGDNIDALSLPELDSMLKLVDDLIRKEEVIRVKEIEHPDENSDDKLNTIIKNIDFYIEIKEVINFARYKKFQDVFKLPPLPSVNKIAL